ncbi:pitrilysin family protein [Salinisphaera sp. Q1T1-3]|uniref:M16 family metallopeptidase n=1 Tax=Salinisphaera sp. Q1T1-3 TaxID=2321229 RepID=UPI000E743CD4|nr:pitrilysin family protein [Salinisphaera sp. Q1T1-3]RJS91073.1 insulinase family protein [Salinisphaera sp. Q1T1-3]
MLKHALPAGAMLCALLGTPAAFAQNSGSQNASGNAAAGSSAPQKSASSEAAAGPDSVPTSDMSAPASNVARETLDNGLQVIVVPDHLAPVATTMLTYHVGSREVPQGFPGMAHAQEHMMFRGTKNLSAAQIAAIGAAMGGDVNAFTTNDSTSYFFTMPSQFTDVALRLHAERMKNVLDSKKDWQQERGAIEQEVSQDMSSPIQVAIKRMRAQLYAGTPYSHDALGTRDSFDKTTAKMLKRFHDAWYAPNNATLVVTGDVDPDKILAEAKQLFARIPSKKLPERPAIKPEKLDAKTIRMPTDSGYGFAILGFRAPGTRDVAASATSQVLASVLNNPRGPLYTQMVASGKSLAAQFGTLPAAEASLGVSYVVFPKGADADALVKQMRSILGDIADKGITADQVAAAKRSLITQDVAQRDSIHGLAMRWSTAVAVNGLDSPGEMLDAIKNVKPADVNRMLASVIQPDQSVLAVLTPEGSGAPQSGGGYGGSESFAPKNVDNVKLPEWAAKPLAEISTPTQSISPVETTLDNGLRLITVPSDSVHAVHVYGHIRNAPDLEQPQGQTGVDDVLAQMLDYGTKKHDRKAYQAALDAIGANASAGTDFSLTVLPDHLGRGLSLLAENELSPALPKPVFKALQQRSAATQAGVIASPDFKSDLALQTGLLPKDDPSLRYATPDSISGLTHDDVTRYYDKVFRPDLATIVVVGNVDPAQVKKDIEASFGDWKAKGDAPDVDLPPVPANGPSNHHVPDDAQSQDTVHLAETLGLTTTDSDYRALKLANQVLTGSMFASRLYRELRVERGLVYYVTSGFNTSRTRTQLIFRYGSDPDKVDEANQLIRKALVKMAKVPVSDAELHRAKAGLIRQVPLGEASASAIGYGLLSRVELGQPLDEPYRAAKAYQAIGADEIQSVFKKWIRPDDLVRVVQGPKPE